MPDQEYLSVSQLTHYIKAKFDRDPYLEKVFVTGEVSNFHLRPGKTQFFQIKDDQAEISATLFPSIFKRLAFDLEDGMNVLVTGHISVYERRGQYQITVDSIQPDGIGALYAAYEQLKKKLRQEGLFDRPKRAIPKFPKKIAVLTSRSGAVIEDIMTTVRRRYPKVQLVLYPTVVQGERAAQSLIRNLQRVEQDGSYDTVIVGRGGGSIEDLWGFNDEQLARTVADMETPVITSVGHETDTTLIDYVADQRAATPTAAAELATPSLADVLLQIQRYRQLLFQRQQVILKRYREQLESLKRTTVFKYPNRLFDERRQHISLVEGRLQDAMFQGIRRKQRQIAETADHLRQNDPKEQLYRFKNRLVRNQQRLDYAMTSQLKDVTHRLQNASKQLDLLSPLKRLSNGYAYATHEGHPVLKSGDLAVGDQMNVTFSDGSVRAEIREKYEKTEM
ncbi:MAG: exodeoxyribonuclease VII large subunit [Aerococcus sp.]|nr:exodeoxyribonuclease VII large subunit [Aerococcus sp.]